MFRLRFSALAVLKARLVLITGLLILGLLIVIWRVQQSNVDSLKQQIDNLQQEIQKLPDSVVKKDKIALQKDLLIIEKDRVNAQNGIYGTLVQAIGGVFFFITAYFTWRNVKATEEKQVTERFSKAIEQLGSEKLEVRLGGIHSLERIARDSEKDYWTIMEILTSFLHEHSSAMQQELKNINTDIQAVLTVIGRRNFSRDPKNKKLDLSSTNLTSADLSGANLRKANLRGTVLKDADLKEVDFMEADLCEANLSKANMSRANLSKADTFRTSFKGTCLIEANFTDAKSSEADFSDADLQKANLCQAFFLNANFSRAKLPDANLRKADLSKVRLNDVNLCNADLSETNLFGIQDATPERIKTAKNWQYAKYDENFRTALDQHGRSNPPN